ncbi:MAG TPA: 16S rRNA (cytosine(1402)-N(4))-methyltransferase RsmH [Acidimicrobiales bacterium]|jgi:16S rRNA (cytosine1402-N4)-methyltransferase|nr:16S rRNA (cytosine(1402)-N(4))-methyltransferase RsmH [Acidimicrobiales bacterium]
MSWNMRSPSAGTVEEPHSARFRRARSGRHPDGTRPTGGLRMSQDARSFEHRPVMVDEIVDLLGPVPGGYVLDGTLGGAGHAAAILEAHPHLSILGIDRDHDALEAASGRLAPFGDRASIHHARFDGFRVAMERAGISWLSGALFDLGVSSWQLDAAERGFSYREDAPLDMRMDRSDPTGRTAADIVNTADEATLTKLFAEHGEQRFAKRIARAVVAARPLRTTADLVDAVKRGIPAAARRTGGHPAKRVFQALRVEVNDELAILPSTLDDVIDALVPGGRLAVLAYHSGEDRIVKDRFRSAATGDCTCPPGLPCVCGAPDRITVRLLTRGSRKPSPQEIAANPRAESARLRAVEKLPPRTTTS